MTVAIHLNALCLMPLPKRYSKLLLSLGILLQSIVMLTLLGSIGSLLLPYPVPFVGFITLTWLILIYYEINFVFHISTNDTLFSFLRLIPSEKSNIEVAMKRVKIPWFLITFVVMITLAIGPTLFFGMGYLAPSSFILEHTLFFPLGLSLILLALFDLALTRKMPYAVYVKYRSSLPFERAIFSPRKERVDIKPSLSPIKEGCQSSHSASIKKPPIFLFILESVRESSINPIVAPHLTAFKEENISFPFATSAGNASFLARHTIFNAEHPLRWSQEKGDQIAMEGGSLPLRHLKEMGYQIHLYSGSSLVYYRQKKMIFGREEELLDQIFDPAEQFVSQKQVLFGMYQEMLDTTFEASKQLPTYKKDALVMEKLIQDLSIYGTDGHLFIIFLDSPHFAYSWPEKKADDYFNLFRLLHTNWDRDKIMSAYHHSIRHVDDLIGTFLKTPKPSNSVIAITADHGEEFYEMGNITHFPNLSNHQLHVPLYFRFGEDTPFLKKRASSIASHVDIFPTLFDYMGTSIPADGESIFKEGRWPYTICGHRNGPLSPRSFCINDLHHKMIVTGKSWKGWSSSSKFYFSSLLNQQNEIVHNEEVKRKLETALKSLLKSSKR